MSVFKGGHGRYSLDEDRVINKKHLMTPELARYVGRTLHAQRLTLPPPGQEEARPERELEPDGMGM